LSTYDGPERRRGGPERRTEYCGLGALHEQRMENIESACAETRNEIVEVRKRVYNGMAAELRSEVKEEFKVVRDEFNTSIDAVKKQVRSVNGGTRKLLIGIAISLFMLMAGGIIEGVWSSKQASTENDRNLRAILELDKKLEIHLISGTTK
jgi:hypothetical protein